jgi:CRISPR/Cas system CSM-associated protein Csm3 (group 7 of RAMP superfamily)
VDDAIGKATGVELRDGVKLNSATRTAGDRTKFDLQLWQAGTHFPLRLELLLTGTDDELLKQALVTALAGLNNGSITLGARKRRGFGIEMNIRSDNEHQSRCCGIVFAEVVICIDVQEQQF